jgi:hypothetical protein
MQLFARSSLPPILIRFRSKNWTYQRRAGGHISADRVKYKTLSALDVKVELADVGLRLRVGRSGLAFRDDDLTPGEIEKISV